MNYLQKILTIEEACLWLETKTAQRWTLPRLIDAGLMPWFWIDYSPGWPELFGEPEKDVPLAFLPAARGYLAPLFNTLDLRRLAAGASDVIVSSTRTRDGREIFVETEWRFPLDELRFKAEDIELLASGFSADKGGVPASQGDRKPRLQPDGGDELTRLIWLVCYDAHDAGGSLKPIDVMARLKNLADSGQPPRPLIGSISNGIKFENADGDEKELSSDALRKRIEEWKKRCLKQ
ncbi:hypothetical protein [Massilia sp. YMA4]|uniref:hypothetical protein n=1 Tax=Massilia sp. YMA4 TaxID=1593482 RepID=UPI0015835FE7|nr:hypothetical protein [Massilia sp. YMA4]